MLKPYYSQDDETTNIEIALRIKEKYVAFWKHKITCVFKDGQNKMYNIQTGGTPTPWHFRRTEKQLSIQDTSPTPYVHQCAEVSTGINNASNIH
jgi:hypothetical protein